MPTASVSISTAAGTTAIDRRIFGSFIEHFHRLVYGGIFDPGSPLADARGFRTDVADAVRELGLPVVRWPGGCFVSAYHWLDGVGDRRLPRFDKAWLVTDPNTFGTHEFVQWCDLVGTEPYICTDAGAGAVAHGRGPGHRGRAAGFWFEEFSNLEDPIPVASAATDFLLPNTAEVRSWVDGLIVDDARILAHYRHPRFGDFPVVTTRTHEDGRITVVGTVPSALFAQTIAAWVVPRPTNTVVVAPDGVSVPSGTWPDGRRVAFVFNWGWGDRSVTVLRPAVDPLIGSKIAAGEQLSLPGWGTRILVSSPEEGG